MSKSKVLYKVYAVVNKKSFLVYETTKQEKAYSFVKSYTKENNDIDEIYIDKEFMKHFDKRGFDEYDD